MKSVLAINTGSSSFKFKLFALKDEEVLAEGMADRIGMTDASFTLTGRNKQKYVQNVEIPTQEAAVELLISALKKYKIINNLNEIIGIGHRIVAGGESFQDSTLITQDNLQEIFDLGEYAPLHNRIEGQVVKKFMDLLPGVPEVGVFDTSFHQTLDPIHYLYSVPYKWYKKYGVRKYGAHGTSIRYVSQRAAQLMHKNLADLKLIVCHLGSGASITAVKNGKSYDTSMGFSPVAGITMSSRSGDVDPSLLEYVMEKEKIPMKKMIDILETKSGLLGISELSKDMRDIKHNLNNRQALLARNIFKNRILRYVGAYITEMAGADAIIFTAGIGEHDSGVRQSVMEGLKIFGLVPDLKANELNKEGIISKPESKIKALIIPTNEELMIERDVVRVTNLSAA
ncbi:acetate kinase [Lactobacillus sp. PV037]|uniref:acetate/propionate family kinase n=1 Tax=unclassified Lactobacillus TaxID=2620435 RepID=UPI00223F75FF|nr:MULTISPECIES: acetate kinase [unclassified Lactobacillus]QNQ82336.1 acetate kinase [Lactobacillus sp. PV012]QNQ83552.1 acetate kinase [Lactobacillus sp. PV037]